MAQFITFKTFGLELYHPFAYSHDIIDGQIYIPTRNYHQEVKWSVLNDWALGLPIDPKQNPINSANWNEENIDNSPMFKSEQFGKTTAEVNGWFGTNMGIGSENSFGLQNKLNSKMETNLFAKMSSKSDNLRKLNDINYKNSNSNSNSNSYKQITDNWSHSIYLI